MRKERTIADLEAFLGDLEDVSNDIRGVIKRMRETGMDVLYVHGNAPANTHLPIIWDWTQKIKAELEVQLRAFQGGRKALIQIRAEKYKESVAASEENSPALPVIIKQVPKKKGK